MDPCTRERVIYHPRHRQENGRGFTILELLVASAVLGLILVMLFSVISHTSEAWRRSRGHIEAFQSARNAFEIVTRTLSQATLNTHWHYDNATNPTRYLRASDLHFTIQQAGTSIPGTPGTGFGVFFQAPIGIAASDDLRGLNTLLNGMGYYIQFSGDGSFRPSIVNGEEKRRYRLVQMRIPSENLNVYTATNATDYTWFTSQTKRGYPVSDNIILLVVWPRLPFQEDPEGGVLSLNFTYNSRLNASNVSQPRTASQLPPVVEVLMVAIDEASAVRLTHSTAEPPAIKSALQGKFQTASQSAFGEDLKQLESALTDAKINYQIFHSAIPMRESKWSE